MAWKNHKVRRESRVCSVHEAGHAVIAAHLGVPFKDVSEVLARVQTPAPYLTLQNLSGSAAMDFLRHYAVMLCASRAAVDEILPGQGEEFNYRGDEDDLEEIASILGVRRSEFSSWRLALLGEARRLVPERYSSGNHLSRTGIEQTIHGQDDRERSRSNVELCVRSTCDGSSRRRTMPIYIVKH